MRKAHLLLAALALTGCAHNRPIATPAAPASHHIAREVHRPGLVQRVKAAMPLKYWPGLPQPPARKIPPHHEGIMVEEEPIVAEGDIVGGEQPSPSRSPRASVLSSPGGTGH